MRELPPRVIDAAITVVVVAATVLPMMWPQPPAWWIVGLGLAASLPVLWRRRWPLSTALVVGVAITVLVTWEKPYLPWGPLVGIYTIADLAPRWARLLAVPVVAAGVAVSLILPAENAETYRVIGTAFVAAYALGTSARANRERALRIEQERATAIERERTRIARDMHDIVTHSVGRMVVQAETGPLVLKDEARAVAAFDAIADTGREALTELRGLLSALRRPGEPEPQPGLEGLPGLLDRSGLDATLTTEGEPRPIAAGAGVAVYRIVQEALTNVLRHAGTKRVTVRLRWSDERLEVEVADKGRGGPRKDGFGLVGMGERAAAVGGTLDAGPGAAGGFVVKAAFPVG
ncbi:sensor histidine kinase [Nonomuraea sp. NPDC050556]|uniref:sensor histidine kinase n=1 Tax=Nonomuraea sp. NPDC050556 TaxID=3364369 RepID=UPI0037A7D3E3